MYIYIYAFINKFKLNQLLYIKQKLYINALLIISLFSFRSSQDICPQSILCYLEKSLLRFAGASELHLN